MLSVPDMALLGAAALLLFGPEQLPKVVRKVGQFTRDMQNTSQSFLREMERAADIHDTPAPVSTDPHAMETYEPFPFDDATPHVDHVAPVGEKLAEPSPALDHADTAPMHEVELPLTTGESAQPLANAVEVALPLTNGEAALPHTNGEAALPHTNGEAALPHTNGELAADHDSTPRP